jgi:hypothetical protein
VPVADGTSQEESLSAAMVTQGTYPAAYGKDPQSWYISLRDRNFGYLQAKKSNDVICTLPPSLMVRGGETNDQTLIIYRRIDAAHRYEKERGIRY